MADRIAIVTDSTCDLPRTLLTEEGIYMVPLSIYFGEEEVLDGVDLSPAQFYEKLQTAKKHPTTSQPPPGKFLNLFQELQKEGYTQIVCIHITRKFSGTAQSATVAATMVPEMKIKVIDSKTTTGSLGALVRYANQLVKNGMGFDAVIEKIIMQLPRTAIYFSVDSLESLQRGGRIGKARALIGKYLGIRPLMALHENSGEIEVINKARSVEAACRMMAKLARAHIEKYGVCHQVVLLTAMVEDYGVVLQKAMTSLAFDFGHITQVKIGGVIGTHLGPTGWGIGIC
ncbi:DegV family protein [bacterium]|nr:DegV family protein [bacterium]